MISAIALIGMIAVAVGLIMYNKPHRVIETASPAFTMPASQLVDEFSSDEAQANARYVGKVIQLNGRLKDVIQQDSTLILLLGDTSQIISVSCYLQNGDRFKKADPVPGEMVTVKGICNGMLMDVVLDKAILLTGEVQ